MLSENNQANAEEVLYAINHIEEYVKGIDSIEELKSKPMVCDAVMINFILIGEACKRLTEAFNQRLYIHFNRTRYYTANDYLQCNHQN